MSRRRPVDDDHNEDEVLSLDEAPRSRRYRANRGYAFVPAVSLAAWLVLMSIMFIGGLLFVVSLKNANGAVQEAALGAVFSTVFIGLYITVRCIEKVLASNERIRLAGNQA